MEEATPQNENVWLSVDQLIADAEAVHGIRIPWKGRYIELLYQELKAEEMPSVVEKIKDFEFSKDGKVRMVQLDALLARETTWAMIEKGMANGEPTLKITRADFDRLPERLKNLVISEIGRANIINVERF